LTLVDVNVKSIDYSARYLYPNRMIEIKTKPSRQSVLTPTRAATLYEYKEKAKVPTDIPIENQISVNIEKLSYTRFQKLLTTNHYFGKMMRRIDLGNRLAQYSDLRVTLLQPTVTPKIDRGTKTIIRDSPMGILQKDSALRERFIRFVIRLQQEIGLDIITIPFLDLPFHVFQDIVTEIDKNLERIDRQALFFVDIGYEKFESAIELIADDLEAPMIGLIFKRYRRFPLSYEVLSRYIDKDIAFCMVQVNRYDSSYDDISTMHYLPFFGNDIYAVKTPAPFGPGKKVEEEEPSRPPKPPKDRLQYIRLFDRESLRVSPILYEPSISEKLADEYENDVIVADILENYREARYDEEKYKVLRAFSKVSELNSSLSEFERFQDYIEESSARDYIQEKETLQRTLREARRHSPEHPRGEQIKLA